MQPLDAARELVTVLEQLTALDARREQLIAALAGTAAGDFTPKQQADLAAVVDNSTVVVEYDGEPVRTTYGKLKAAADPIDPDLVAPPKMTEAEAMSIYEANVEPASDAQRRMIFGILNREFGVKGDDNLKAAIVALLAHQHHGEKIQSISKELSSAWASGLIDWLLKGKKSEIKEIIKSTEVPF